MEGKFEVEVTPQDMLDVIEAHNQSRHISSPGKMGDLIYSIHCAVIAAAYEALASQGYCMFPATDDVSKYLS